MYSAMRDKGFQSNSSIQTSIKRRRKHSEIETNDSDDMVVDTEASYHKHAKLMEDQRLNKIAERTPDYSSQDHQRKSNLSNSSSYNKSWKLFQAMKTKQKRAMHEMMLYKQQIKTFTNEYCYADCDKKI